jgi:hypothetical protein
MSAVASGDRERLELARKLAAASQRHVRGPDGLDPPSAR